VKEGPGRTAIPAAAATDVQTASSPSGARRPGAPHTHTHTHTSDSNPPILPGNDHAGTPAIVAPGNTARSSESTVVNQIYMFARCHWGEGGHSHRSPPARR